MASAPVARAGENKTFARKVLADSRWETTCHVRSSGRPGPVVVVMGGVHGNEPAGAAAASRIFDWPLLRGSMLVLPRANEPALRAGSRYAPHARHADIARCFPRAPGDAPRGPLAQALWSLLVRLRPDWLVDLHEGWGVHRQTSKTLGSTVMHHDATLEHAERMVQAVNRTIRDPSKHFVPVETFIPGSSVHAASQFLGVACVVQETTRAGRKLGTRVHQHEAMTRRLLADLGMVGEMSLLRPG